MMNHISKISKSLITMLLLIMIGLACTSNKNLTGKPVLDKQLIGEWVGQEVDKQVEGIMKEWEMTRFADGTFTLIFKTTNKDGSRIHTEVGTWWVKDGIFYEFHNNSKLTDTYKYQVINKDLIKFELINTDINFNNPQYIFYDKRK